MMLARALSGMVSAGALGWVTVSLSAEGEGAGRDGALRLMGRVLAQDGEVASGAQFLDLGERDGDFAGHVALEDDGVAGAAEEGAGELVAVGEDDDVGGGGGLGLGGGDGWQHRQAQDRRQDDQTFRGRGKEEWAHSP